MADIQVNLLCTKKIENCCTRCRQSGTSGNSENCQKYGANVKIIEVPPGPPVYLNIKLRFMGQIMQTKEWQTSKDILHKTDGIVESIGL
jgi:hypothetical protein